jgi:acetyl esterase
MQTASHDPLRDQAADYARKAIAAGAPVVHLEAEGMIHGYATLRRVMPSARQDVESLVQAGMALLGGQHAR